MKLTVNRNQLTNKSTIGELWIDGKFECYTLEDVCRKGIKISGQTAIPEGTYEVIIDYSNRFKKDMPHVLNVPGFEGIRIHPGNTAENTEGCLLVGMSKSNDFIGGSKAAFEKITTKLIEGLKHGKIFIEYKRI